MFWFNSKTDTVPKTKTHTAQMIQHQTCWESLHIHACAIGEDILAPSRVSTTAEQYQCHITSEYDRIL